jgi:hypothetical protein
MITQNGTIVRIEDPNEALRRFQAGELGFVQGDRIRVIDRTTGDVGTIASEEAPRALAGDRWQLPTPAEDVTQDRAVRAATPRQRSIAAGEAVIRGLTFGAGMEGIQALVAGGEGELAEASREAISRHSEDIQARRDALGVAGSAIELGTMVVPTIVSGGTTLLARAGAGVAARQTTGRALAGQALRATAATRTAAALTPTALLARGTAAIERGIASAVTARTGNALVGRLAGVGLSAAAEGSIYGGGMALNEAAMGGTAITAERMLAGMGTGALLGFGVGGGLVGAGALGRAGLRQGIRGSRALRDGIGRMWQRRTGQTLLDGISDAAASVTSTVTGADDTFLREAFRPGSAGARRRGQILAGDAPVQQAIPRLRSTIDELNAVQNASRGELSGPLKRGSVLRQVATERFDDAANAARTLQQEVRAVADDIADNATRFSGSGNVHRRVANLADEAAGQIDEAIARGGREGAADMFIAVDNLKRSLGPQVRQMQRSSPATAQVLEDVVGSLRTHLEDTNFYGTAAATQREVNGALSPYLANLREFQRVFMTRSGTQEGFRDVLTANPKTLGTFFRNLGRAENAHVEDILRNHLTLQQNAMSTMAKHMDLPSDLTSAITQSGEAAPRILRLVDETGEVVRAQNQYKDVMQSLQQSSPLIAGAVGFAAGGPATAAAGVAATRPDLVIRTLGAMDRVIGAVTRRIDSSATGFVRESIERAGRTLTQATRGARRAARTAAVPATEQAFFRTVDRLREINANPEQIDEALVAQGRVSQAAPAVTAAMSATATRAVQFLGSRIPPVTVQDNLLQPQAARRLPVSSIEMNRFMRYARAIDNPLSLVEDLREGTITQEAAEAVRTVYPELFEQISQSVLTALSESDQEIAYQDRIRLGIMLQAPTDPTLEPSFVISVQQALATAEQPEDPAQAQPQPLLTPGQREAPEVAQQQETLSTRLERRVA